MIGDVAAAVDLMNLNAAIRQKLVARKNVGAAGVAAERQHRRMLQQEEGVADAVLVACFDEQPLQFQTFGVRNPAELEKIENHCAKNGAVHTEPPPG